MSSLGFMGSFNGLLTAPWDQEPFRLVTGNWRLKTEIRSGWASENPQLPVTSRFMEREHLKNLTRVGAMNRSASRPGSQRLAHSRGPEAFHRAGPGHALRPGTGRARVPGRRWVYRDERFPTGACDANRSRTARSSPQGAGAKGWKANARLKEHKWAVRQDVRGEQASTREAQESLMAFCRAQRPERKDRALTRGDPGAERRQEVSR